MTIVRQQLKEQDGEKHFTASNFVNVAVKPQIKEKTNTCNPLVGGCLNGDRKRQRLCRLSASACVCVFSLSRGKAQRIDAERIFERL